MNKLKELRLKNNMKQSELALRLNVSQAAISAWERDVFKINSNAVIQLANFFGVSTDYILGNETDKAKEMKRYIVMPEKNIESISSAGILSPSVEKCGEYICFSVIGNSMTPDMRQGDIAIVRLADEYKTGDIVLVAFEEGYRALQHITEVETGIILKSLNPEYNLIPYSHRQLQSCHVYIAGKLVEVRRRYK